jgi:hypothetical protein
VVSVGPLDVMVGGEDDGLDVGVVLVLVVVVGEDEGVVGEVVVVVVWVGDGVEVGVGLTGGDVGGVGVISGGVTSRST